MRLISGYIERNEVPGCREKRYYDVGIKIRHCRVGKRRELAFSNKNVVDK